MTVFPDGSKEPLHGHNYITEVTIDLPPSQTLLKDFIPFAPFKSAIKAICEQWDEKVLLPQLCPFLQIQGPESGVSNESLEFILCKKRYVLPLDEAVFLNVENVTSETLAQEFLLQFLETLRREQLINKVIGIQVRIDESPGQGASVFWNNTAE